VQVDLSDALEAADEEGAGREQFARRCALDMPLAEAGVELFQESRLLGADRVIAFPAFAVSSASQRSMRVPRPLSLRIF
jgi:hypothetical protein